MSRSSDKCRDPFATVYVSQEDIEAILKAARACRFDLHAHPREFLHACSARSLLGDETIEAIEEGMRRDGGVVIAKLPVDIEVETPSHARRVKRSHYINEFICAVFAQFGGYQVFGLAEEKDGQYAINVAGVPDHAVAQSHMGYKVDLRLHVENVCFRPIGLAPDRLALLCVRPAASGGETMIMRSDELVEHLTAREIEMMEEPWLQTHFPPSVGLDGWSTPMPMLDRRDGRFVLSLDMTGQRVWPGLAKLEWRERSKLLEKVTELARVQARPVGLKSGELMLWSNEHAHGRTAFRLDSNLRRSRYLVRMLARAFGSLPEERRCSPCCYTARDEPLVVAHAVVTVGRTRLLDS